MGTLLGQAPELTLQNQGRQVRADIAAIDALAEAFRAISLFAAAGSGAAGATPRQPTPGVQDPPPNEWTEALGGGGGDDRATLELDLDNHRRITPLNANTGTGVD